MRNRFSTLTTVLMIALTSWLRDDLMAQCVPSFITPDVTIALDNTTGMAQISTAELIGAINKSGPDCGDFVFYPGGAPTNGAVGTAEPYPLTCGNVGTFQIWVTLDDLTDGSDNIYNVPLDYGPWQMNITVVDATNPSLVCPANVVVSANINCEATIGGLGMTYDPMPFAGLAGTYSDNCNVSVAYAANNGASPASAGSAINGNLNMSAVIFQLGVTTVDITATDASGNTAMCSFTVTVNDTDEPYDWVDESTNPADWYAIIGVSPMSNAIASITYGGPGTNRLTVTLNCDDPDYSMVHDWFAMTYVPTAIDNCDPNPTEIFVDEFVVNPPACPLVEHIRRRWRAQDASGNAIPPPGPTAPLAKLDLVTNNTVAPTFTTAPVDVTINANDPMTCGLDITGMTMLQVAATSDCQGAPTYSWVINSAPGLFVGATASVGNDDNADQFYIPGTYNITYTATDGCGNATAHNFNFYVIDVVPPMVMCPPNQVLDNVLDNCFQNTIWDEATVTDNCPGSLNLAVAGIDPDGNPINILTFQGVSCSDQMDFAGNYSPGNWSPPVAGVDWSGAPASLDIVNSGPPSPKDVTTTAMDGGIIIFNWSYTPAGIASGDDFGYLLNGTYYPLVGPLPSIATSGTTVVGVNPGDGFGFRLIDGAFSAATVTISGFQFICGSGNNVSFASFPVGTSVIMYTVTDQAMNTATCTFSVTVNDVQAPEITCGGGQFLPSICTNQAIPDYTGNVSVLNENCPDYTITQIPVPGTTLGTIFAPNMPVDGGTFDVTLEVTDKGGNTDQCVFTVTLVDNGAPVPDVSPLPSINPMTTLGTDCHSYMLCAPTATDCNGNVIYGTASIAGSTFDPNGCGAGQPGYLIHAPGNYAILWIYDDGNGNIASQGQQVDIYDDATNPTLNCPPNIVVMTDPGLCSTTGIGGLSMTEVFPTTPPYLQPVDFPADGEMIDNCGIVAISWQSNTGAAGLTNNAGTGTYPKGVSVVTYTAEDNAGNTGTCSFTITVEDKEDPTFSCTISANPFFPTLLNTGSAGDENDADCGYTLSILDVSLDPINLNDNCPGPITKTYTVFPGPGSAGFNPGPDPGSLAGSTFLINPSFPGAAGFMVVWTVTDAMGNADQCTGFILVRDNQNPTISCPTSPQVRTTSQDGNPGDCYYEASGGEFNPLGYMDNCNTTLVFNDFNFSNNLDNEFFPGGSTIVTWTVYDIAGNSGTCAFTVTVNDDEPPVNTYCPPNVTLPNILGDCNNDVAWLRPSQWDWTDNCTASPDLIITESISDPGVQAAINNNDPYDQTLFISNPQTSFPVGTTIITYKATDLANNMSTCSFTVTIQDIEAPQVICPADDILGITCSQGVVPNYIPLITLVSDNCSDFTITQSPSAGTSLASVPGLTPADGEVFDVTISVTDNKPLGLSSSCTFSVTLDEISLPVPNVAGPNLPPAFSECNDITIAAPSALECGNTIYGIPSQGTLVNVMPPIYQYGIGNYFIIWTYVGANGAVQQSQQITVLEDLTPPNAQCKPVSVNLSSSNPGTVNVSATAFNNGSTDNCQIVGYSFSTDGGSYSSSKSFGCSDVGVHNISLEVLDFNNNKGYCNTTLTVNDITHPTIVGGCPGNMSFPTSNNGGYDCDGLATIPVPDVTDNCAIGSYILNIVSPGGSGSANAFGQVSLFLTLEKGVHMMTYEVTDEHGNSSTCSFQVTIFDDENPMITCSDSGTRYTSQDGTGDCAYTINGSEFDPLSWKDNCPGATMFNDWNGSATLDGEVFTVGSYDITWYVFDAVGHSVSCSNQITIEDDEPPIINWCQGYKSQNVTAGTCNALVTWTPTFGVGTGHVQDNCGIDVITETISDPDVVPVYPYNQNGPYPPFFLNQALFPIGITTITYTVSDIHGNTSICVNTIEVIDNIAPSVVCPPAQVMPTICANGNVQDYLGAIQNVMDNCPGALLYTQSPAAGTPLSSVPGLTPADGESFTVTITVTDPKPQGLSGNCQFTVTLDDVNLPVPDQASLTKDSTDCNSLILSPPTANDCGTLIYGIPDKGNQIQFNPPLYEFTAGLYTVIWTYVGANGSVQQIQQLIVENDLVPPVMDCDDITITLDAAGNASITPGQVDGGTKDNCGIANLSLSKSVFGCADVGNNTIVLTATDVHGNSNTCQAHVFVRDLTPPTFNLPNSSVTVDCQSIPGIPNVISSDACGVATQIPNETNTKGLNANNCNFYTYTITRTWTATDVNANVSTLTQVIHVQDVTAPVWTSAMPDTIYGVTNQFNCLGQIFLVVDNIKVTDNCAAFANLDITYTGSNGTSGTLNASGQYPIGKTTLTFVAEDPCGNISVKQVIIIIEDKTPPTAVCVNSIVLPLNPQGNLVIPPFIVDNGSYDNCLAPFSTTDVTLDVFPDTFNCTHAGKTLTVTLTVTDLAGNTASCPASLTVLDNTIPTLISCVPDVTIDCASDTGYVALGGLPVVTDACGTTFDYSDAFVQIGGAICYNILRTWKIEDASQNTLFCTQTISVTDNQVPTFTSALPANITIGCGGQIPTPPIITASDNCGTPVSVQITETSTQTSNHTCSDYAYQIFRTWTATDACGNSTAHQQTITIVDTQAPVIFGLPDSLTFYTNDFNADSCTVPVTLVAQFVDCENAADITVVNNSPVGSGGISASGKYSADQLYTITFTATDLCGNVSQKVVKVRVIDNSIPNAFCIAVVNASLNSDGLAVITPSQIDDQSRDNCTPSFLLNFSLSKDSFDCKNLGANTVLLTVTDQQGNSNTCSATVNISADPALTINTTVSVTPETFMNAADGAINVGVSGGSGSFTYLWTPGNAVTPSISGLISGTYTLMITDNNTGCMKTLNVFVPIAGVPFDTISGKILTPAGKPVARTWVEMTGSQSGLYYTTTDGYYEFIVPSGSTVTVHPYKDTLPANGVTSLDFAIIQAHILAPPNLKPLTTSFQLIAADENGNNQINGIDIANFQYTILNNKDTFPHVESWVFVVEGYAFPMPTEPWATGWDDFRTYAVISGNKVDQNFIAVKMGDVNGDVDVTKIIDHPGTGETRNARDLIFQVQDLVFHTGDVIRVPMTASNFDRIRAYQLAWSFDPAVLSFNGATGQNLAGFTDGLFGTSGLETGLLTHLWSAPFATDMGSEDVLFTLEFTALSNGQLSNVLTLTDSYMGRIAYVDGDDPMEITMAYSAGAGGPIVDPDFTLLGSRPNPFSDQTLIEFSLPGSASVHMTVFDLAGRPVLNRRTDGIRGRNIIPIHASELSGPGLYTYILEANGERRLGKLIYQN